MDARFEVPAYSLGPDGRLKLGALFDWLQEAAGRHAEALGVSMARLREEGLAWVLARMRVRIDRWPSLHEAVVVETWPASFGPARARRDFLVRDGSGGLVAAAASEWVVMAFEARRLVRVPAFVRAVPVEAREALADDGARLVAPERVDLSRRFEVRRDDLDVVGHVNNARYASWIEECVPDEVLAAKAPAEVTLVFKAEARRGDAAVVETTVDGGAFTHRIRREGDGRELVLATSRWR